MDVLSKEFNNICSLASKTGGNVVLELCRLTWAWLWCTNARSLWQAFAPIAPSKKRAVFMLLLYSNSPHVWMKSMKHGTYGTYVFFPRRANRRDNVNRSDIVQQSRAIMDQLIKFPVLTHPSAVQKSSSG
jgi:hypothetical protein